MQENLLNQLKANKPFMSTVEKKITDVILEDAKGFLTCGIAEFATTAGVSQGSVINFANKFAHGGFPELKLQIATCFAGSYDGLANSLVGLEKRIDCVNKAFISTNSQNDNEVIEKVANLIIKAKKVEIYGIYRSAVVATDFYFQLLQMGIPANFVSDVLTCAVSASLLQKDSLVIAVSSSGRTKDVIDAVKLAKENGVKVVCITANKNSPLAKLADYVLVACACGTSEQMALEIRLSQLVITDAICEHIYNCLKEQGKEINNTMEKILTSHNVND